MDAAFHAYSAAQALRSGGREPVLQALLAARRCTPTLADAYAGVVSEKGKNRTPRLSKHAWLAKLVLPDSIRPASG